MHKQGVNSSGEVIRDVFVEHDPVDLLCDPAEGMTRQEFKDECDINFLMATYEKTGVMSHLNPMAPQYLDVSDVPDLPKAIAVMNAAEAAFMTLPASIRREFDNSAVSFVEFAQDPRNLDKMREWGLAAPLPPAAEPAGEFSEPKGSPSPEKGSAA